MKYLQNLYYVVYYIIKAMLVIAKVILDIHNINSTSIFRFTCVERVIANYDFYIKTPEPVVACV